MDATSKHLRVTDAQRRHFSPAQTGVGQEAHDRRIRPDFNRELLHLPVRQIPARPPLAARKLDPRTRIARDPSILDRHLQYLTQDADGILNGGGPGTRGRHRVDPGTHVRRLDVGDGDR
ncbi:MULTISPECIES: hypothetical protein [Mycobacteriaceae]|uniref:hypothetical protein n=1 Tax=Mycobacteriaceae TaxID=1762 RepID=UPI001F1B19C2|nr:MULTISPECIES: hypothetical protein [Mycobacteriaceae]WAY19019.1 hypothetical protein OF855_27900 [Mycolicibacterium fortuitum]